MKTCAEFILSGFDVAANSNQLTKSITISPSVQTAGYHFWQDPCSLSTYAR